MPGRGEHPNSRANLVPFGPGNNANPGGRPKGRSFASALRELVDRDVSGDKQLLDVIAQAAVEHFVRRGTPGLLKQIVDRLDGPVMPPPPPATTEVHVHYVEDGDDDDDAAGRGPAEAPPGAAADPAGEPPV